MTTTDRRYEIARRLYAARRYVPAAHELEQVIAARGRTPRGAVALLAQAYYRAGALTQAERVARGLLERDALDLGTTRLLVRILQRRGRHEEAVTWMRRLDSLGVDTWDDDATAEGGRASSGSAA